LNPTFCVTIDSHHHLVGRKTSSSGAELKPPEIQITDPLGHNRRRHSSTPSLATPAEQVTLQGMASGGDGAFVPFGKPAMQIPNSVSAPEELSNIADAHNGMFGSGRTIEVS
jgi:hypothetical protein